MANRMSCPMTSRDARWSRLSHIFVINSRNKGYNHSSLGASRLTIGLVCYNHHVNITENLKMRLRIRNESCMYLGYVSVTIIVY